MEPPTTPLDDHNNDEIASQTEAESLMEETQTQIPLDRQLPRRSERTPA